MWLSISIIGLLNLTIGSSRDLWIMAILAWHGQSPFTPPTTRSDREWHHWIMLRHCNFAWLFNLFSRAVSTVPRSHTNSHWSDLSCPASIRFMMWMKFDRMYTTSYLTFFTFAWVMIYWVNSRRRKWQCNAACNIFIYVEFFLLKGLTSTCSELHSY